MTPGLRKAALTAHVTFSVGWLGAVVAYLAIAIACLVNRDAEMVHSGFSVMELLGWLVIVPLSLAALLSGLVQSLGTEWGLFRYYWVLVKFALTVGAVTILLQHMPAVSRGHGAQAEVIHAGGGVLVLLTVQPAHTNVISGTVTAPDGQPVYSSEDDWVEATRKLKQRTALVPDDQS